MTDDITRLAAAFEGAGPIVSLDRRPSTTDEAYDMQDRVRAAIGRPIAGWKLAQTTPAAQAGAGIDAPTVSPLLDGMIVPAGTSFPDGAFYIPAVEAEIVLELAEALGAEVSPADVRAASAGFRVAIEVADTRFADKPGMGVHSTIADMNATGALVLGPLLPIDRLDEALAAPVHAELGDGTRIAAVPPAMKADPLAAVTFLARFVAGRGHGLPAGTVITTGTHTVPTPSGPGRIVAEFQGVGRVEATLGSPRG